MTLAPRSSRAVVAALALVLCPAVRAADPAPQGAYGSVQPLLSTRTTVLGEPFRYPAGTPLIRAVVVTLQPGESTARHHHDAPLFAHILEGELSVAYDGHGSRIYRAGDTFMEGMAASHAGTNVGKTPVRILAAFLESVPPPIRPGAGPELVVVEQAAGRVSAVDPATGLVRASAAVGSSPHEIEISEDGSTAWVTNFGLSDYDRNEGVPGTSVSTVRLADMTELGRVDLPGLKAPHGVKLRPGGRELFVNAENGDRMVVFDPATGTVLRTFPVPEGTHNFLFSRDGKNLFLMAGKGGVLRVDPVTGAVSTARVLETPTRGLAWMPDGNRLLASGKGEVHLLDPETLAVERRLPVAGAGQIIYSASTPDGRTVLAPAPFDGKVFLVDVESGKVRATVATGKAPILVTLSPDGSEAWISNALDDHMDVIDLSTLAVRPSGKLAWPNGARFRPAADPGTALREETRAQLTRLFAALASGDATRVRAWLSPEFQVLRSNGAGYDREGYVARSIPRLATVPRFDDLVVTRGEGTVVARMRLVVDETIDGKRAQSGSPQLIVFREQPGDWKVVAAANLARLDP